MRVNFYTDMNLIRIYTTKAGEIGIDVNGQSRGGLPDSLANNLRREVALVLERAGLLDDVPKPQLLGDIIFDVTLAGKVILYSNGVHTTTLELGEEGHNDPGTEPTRA